MDENKLKAKNVQTYTADMAKVLESGEGGVIKKIIHEEEEHEMLKTNLSPKSRKNRLFMFVSILLLFLAVALLTFLFLSRQKINTVPVAPKAASLIFTDQTEFKAVDGFSRDQLIQTILGQVAGTKVKIGGVDAIYLTEKERVIGLKRFIELIKGSINLKQGFINDNFLLGAFNTASSKDFFILLKISSFADAFPVLRAWEDKMLYDLNSFFGVNITPDTNYLFTKDWQDGIVGNKNARILKDNDGRIVLMYVFINDSSVIVTNSGLATDEVILRIASSQIKK